MKEDLAIARNSLMALQAENAALRQKSYGGGLAAAAIDAHVHDRIDPEMAEALSDEKKKKHELEKELDLQVIRAQFTWKGFKFSLICLDVTEGRNGNGYEVARKGYSRKAGHDCIAAPPTRRHQVDQSRNVPKVTGKDRFKS